MDGRIVKVTSSNNLIKVNHDYGGKDKLRAYAKNVKLENICIHILQHGKEIGTVWTDKNGRWRKAVMLPPGRYTLNFCKRGTTNPTAVVIRVK